MYLYQKVGELRTSAKDANSADVRNLVARLGYMFVAYGILW